MKLTGKELELRYLSKIAELKSSKKCPKWSDKLWSGKFKRQLKQRLEQLEQDYNDGYIKNVPFKIWQKMIKEVI